MAMKERRNEKQDVFDLNALLHPATAFAHPMDVVRHPDLTLNEKRAILSSWASDACALEAAPDLRVKSGKVVRWDDIMDALRTLDNENYGKPLPHYKRVLAVRRFGGRNRNDQGAPLN
jgi:hypothetical protein